MRPLNVLVLAPYLLPTWSLWHLSRAARREAPFDELVEGITIGRRLLPGEYPEGIESVVDLTAEFPESSRIGQGRTYRTFPILDGSRSTPAALEQLAREILELPGDVYIHRAEGHGRTALVATSLLLARGDVRSAGEAVACWSAGEAVAWVLERRRGGRVGAGAPAVGPHEHHSAQGRGRGGRILFQVEEPVRVMGYGRATHAFGAGAPGLRAFSVGTTTSRSRATARRRDTRSTA